MLLTVVTMMTVGPACRGRQAVPGPHLVATTPAIDVWYGTTQRFGSRGNPQRWINILGRVHAPGNLLFSLGYRLNGLAERPLSIGPDMHRLAAPGDFNIEIDRAMLRDGVNVVEILAVDGARHAFSHKVSVHYTKGRTWPLPYDIDWDAVGAIHDAAEVVDGHWALVPGGVRTRDPWYDRVIALGDLSWTDYEIFTQVTFHGLRPPLPDPPTYNVAHAAIAMRWPGHDQDHHQPHRKWYPVGATAEFQLAGDLEGCRWRMLKGPETEQRFEETHRRSIRLGVPYAVKAQVQTDQRTKDTHYRVKLWPADAPEPSHWDLEINGGQDDLPSGGALLIAHNTDVTFGRVEVRHPR